MPAINLIRQAVVALREWAAHGATFTQRVPEVVTKKQTIFGDTLHLLVTLNGVILDFVLAPAHASDLSVGEELRSEHTDVVVLGDKGYNGKC